MSRICKFTVLTLVLFFVLIPFHSVNSEKNRLSLSAFDGTWQGEGTYYLPFTNLPTSIDGLGIFSYDSTSKILNTRFSAERFMIKYTDSGKMSYLPKKDSLKWDIWNSFGYYVQYRGGVDSSSIHGQRMIGKYLFDLFINLVTDDSISIKVTATDSDGDSSERVTGYLRRVNADSLPVE